MSEWHVYIVRTADGSLYTGVATDVERRLEEHRTGGRGARYLRGRGPLELVLDREIGPRGLALKLERRIKALDKEDKEALVQAGPGRARLLARFGL
jgi:putative endonuclease